MLRVPNSENPESLTDWVEASLLVAQERISDSDILDMLDEAGREEDGLEQILQQFQHRSHSMGDRYPIERDGQGFRTRGAWDDYLCYSFLLFVSLNQSYRELKFRDGTAREPAILFELLTARALELFLDAQAVRIGAPREAPVPSSFPACVEYLSSAIQEPVGARDLERQNSGDDGLDIWVTKGFGDQRSSQLFLVAQCAIGEDWDRKRSELDLGLWQRHIDWFTTPLKVFAVPFQLGLESWRETATRGGLILDRPRIARIVAAASFPAAVVRRIRRFTQTRIDITMQRVSG